MNMRQKKPRNLITDTQNSCFYPAGSQQQKIVMQGLKKLNE